MRNSMKALLIFVLIHSNCLFAGQQLFHLKLWGYPKTASKCETTAEQVVKQIQQLGSVTVLDSECVGRGELNYNLNITYTAEKQFELRSSDLWPVHQSYEACIQSLPSEKDRFESVTGLKVTFEYCRHVSADYEHKNLFLRYSTTFYAVGQPKAVEVNFSVPTDRVSNSGYIYGDLKKLGQDILEHAKAAGIPISAVFIDKTDLRTTLWLKLIQPADKPHDFYKRMFLSKDAIEIRSNDWLTAFSDGHPQRMETASQCYEQMAVAKELFSKVFTSPVVWLCVGLPSEGRTKLIHIRIKPDAESFVRVTPGIEGEPFLNEYSYRDKCEQDKPTVLTYYKNKLGENLVGALCSFPLSKNSELPIKMYVYALRDL